MQVFKWMYFQTADPFIYFSIYAEVEILNLAPHARIIWLAEFLSNLFLMTFLPCAKKKAEVCQGTNNSVLKVNSHKVLPRHEFFVICLKRGKEVLRFPPPDRPTEDGDTL